MAAYQDYRITKRERALLGREGALLELSCPGRIPLEPLPASQKDIPHVLAQDPERSQIIFRWTSASGEPVVVKLRQTRPEVRIFDDILHEAFVGLMVTNSLNLASLGRVVWGASQIRSPRFFNLDLEGNLRPYCSCVVYQYVPGVSLYDFLKTCLDPQVVKSLVWQVLVTLEVAHRKVGFTHYDLHLDNIIVRDPDRVPVIIDYGTSHVSHKGRSYGQNIPGGRIYNAPCWLHDVFKFLMTLYQHLNQEVRTYIRECHYGNLLVHLEDQDSPQDKERVEEKLRALKEGRLPPRAYEVGEVVRELIQFFTPMDPPTFVEYRSRHEYLEPSLEILTRYLDYNQDRFMARARTLLASPED